MKTQTTEQAQHTPGPWQVKIHHVDHAAFLVDHLGNLLGDLTASSQEERETIVRACNSHDDLLAACEVAEATIERLQRHAPGSAKGTLDVLRAAILKAKGQ